MRKADGQRDPEKGSPISLQGLTPLDRNLHPLAIGDQVRFVMRGFFLPREQESFGKVIEIDRFGGVRIKMNSVYRHFTSKGRLADVSREVYFVHYEYDANRAARVYRGQSGQHALYIEKVDP